MEKTNCGGVHAWASKSGINVSGCSNPYQLKGNSSISKASKVRSHNVWGCSNPYSSQAVVWEEMGEPGTLEGSHGWQADAWKEFKRIQNMLLRMSLYLRSRRRTPWLMLSWGVNSLATGLQLVGLKVSFIYVCVLTNECMCEHKQLYSSSWATLAFHSLSVSALSAGSVGQRLSQNTTFSVRIDHAVSSIALQVEMDTSNNQWKRFPFLL